MSLYGRPVGNLLVLLLLEILALLAFAASPAHAEQTHLRLETLGTVAKPGFSFLDSIAVDRSTGDLLVIDSIAKTVSRFHADGTPSNFSALGTNVIDAKGAGDGTPQNGFAFRTAGEQQVAIDNSGTVTDGNIYVTQGPQLAGNLIDVFSTTGAYLGQLTGAGATKFGSAGSFPFSPCGVAVDGEGNLFVGAGFENKIYKFNPSASLPLNSDLAGTYSGSAPICHLAVGAGTTADSVFFDSFLFSTVGKISGTSMGPLQLLIPGDWRLIAVNPADGHLFAANENSTVSEYDASGSNATLLSTFPTGQPGGLAVNNAGDRVYAGGGIGSSIDVYGPLVTVPDVTTGPATITGDDSATLKGTVNPDGVALEKCFFEYGLTPTYAQTIPCAETIGEIGTSPKEVHAELSSLGAESLYHYRLVAKNVNATIRGADRTLKTPSKPAIVGLWASEVGFNEATLKAQINPENSPTTYRFEYGPTSSYGQATGEIALGSDNTDHLVSLPLKGLTAGATYHYRVIASNGIGVSEGADHSLTTYPTTSAARTDCPNQVYRTGPSAALVECRAYEMVTPVDKNGGDIKVLVSNFNYPARLEMSAIDGNRYSLSSVTAFADPASAPWTSSYLADRIAGQGWATQSISPPRNSVSLSEANFVFKFDTQFKAFSPDLTTGWLLQDSDTQLDPCADQGFQNLYRRDNATGTYEALVPDKPISVPTDGYGLELQGLSANGSHAVFRSNGRLTKDAPGASAFGAFQVYEHVRGEGCGELRLVSVLPNGKAAPISSASVGTGLGQPGEGRESNVSRAVSADGSRIYWALNATGLAPGPGPLYVRMNGKETVLVSGESAKFWTASVDGGKAYYSIEDTGSPLDRNLYEFDLASKTSTLIAEGSRGVVGASEDANRLYFVSDKALAGAAVAGKPNLYLRDEGTTGFIATLSEEDFGINDHFPIAVVGAPPIRGTRVAPDGKTLVFPSNAPLTGYDNKDANDARPAVELYRYSPANGLACISCNPSGSRPVGRELVGGVGSTRQVSATIPGWENQLQAPRALSDDGTHVFFDSYESLLPRDVNGKADVYEWQLAGSAGECTAAGAELYVPSAGGCLSLISSGQSPTDSEFADATPNGSDVFIRTASSLLPQDPGQVDVYDARVNGGLPQPPAPRAACEGEGCQGPPAAAPNDPTPATSAPGSGNVKEKPKKPRCAKGKVRRHGKCVKKKKATKAKKKASKNRGARR